MPRAFVAIELSPTVVASALDACAAILSSAPAWAGEKWVPPENLHVTLAFFGEVAEPVVPDLKAVLADLCARAHPFQLVDASLRAVPDERRASMLWLQLSDPTGAGAELASAIRSAATPFAPQAVAKTFAAHVTLVRVRGKRPLPSGALDSARSALCIPGPMSVRHATLFSSTLTKAGPIYERIAVFPLGVA